MAKDGKPRGRMSAYAYFVQHCREDHKKKNPNQNVVFAEFSRQCSERWKAASDKEKKKFHDLADKDKKRYEADMAVFKASNKGKKGKDGKKGKRAKDPDAPKRPLSAFFWFCNEERPKVKARMPEASVGTIAKELGKIWNECTEDQKAKFESLAAKDKARYEKVCLLLKIFLNSWFLNSCLFFL